MFAPSASTIHPTRTPLRLLVIGLSLVMAATFDPPSATAGHSGHSGDSPYRGRVLSLMSQGDDLVVVSTNNAYAIDQSTGQPTAASAAQTRLVRALLAAGTPVVVAAMRNPYDVASFPEAPTVLDTYGYTADQTESLVRVLFGEVHPYRRLPVSIPRIDGTGDLFPFGHGLSY